MFSVFNSRFADASRRQRADFVTYLTSGATTTACCRADLDSIRSASRVTSRSRPTRLADSRVCCVVGSCLATWRSCQHCTLHCARIVARGRKARHSVQCHSRQAQISLTSLTVAISLICRTLKEFKSRFCGRLPPTRRLWKRNRLIVRPGRSSHYVGPLVFSSASLADVY